LPTKKQYLFNVPEQPAGGFFRPRPKTDFGAEADRKLDFVWDRIWEGFCVFYLLISMSFPREKNNGFRRSLLAGESSFEIACKQAPPSKRVELI